MKRYLIGLGMFACLSFSLSVSALEPPAPENKSSPKPFDINQPQSPARRTPVWFQPIDQGTNDPRLKGYLTPEGVKLEIVADFPTVVNPVGMTFGDDGTLYVLEWRPGTAPAKEVPQEITYKDGSKRRLPVTTKDVKDLVKVLRDTKGNGVFDQASVLLEEELPSSILVHDGWLYLSGRGTVRRYRLGGEPGNPKPEIRDPKPEVIARGFGGVRHRQVSGLTIGNDGWLLITAGAGDHFVEGADGSRATVLHTGAVFRCRPDGSKVHVYSLGYCNPYRDVAFDSAFNFFHADNDAAVGGKFTGCRLVHVAEASDLGWRLQKDGGPDRLRSAVFGELPGKLPPLLKTGRGGPAGLFIYNDSRFPEHYRGLLFYPDVVRQSIRAYKVEPDGSTFEVVEEFELLRSNDPLFRPCQMVLGPDGAMYICDWRSNSDGASQLWGDGKHGRIYRVSWSGTEGDPALPLRGLDSWGRIARLAEEDLLKTLAAEDLSDRLKAQQELVRRGEKVRPPLLKLLDDPLQPLPARIAALGALQSLWNAEVQRVFMNRLRDGEGDIRRLAAEGLGLNCKRGDPAAHNALLQDLGDPDYSARRAMALAMGRIAAEGAADALVTTFKVDDGKDPTLSDGLLRAIERTGMDGIQKLLEVVDSGVEKDRDKIYGAFLALRIRPAAEVLPALLNSPHPSTTQRASLIRSSTNYLLDPPVSLERLLDYLLAHPGEAEAVKQAALEVLTVCPRDPRMEEKIEKFAVPLLDGGKASGLLSSAVVVLGATPKGARLVGERFLAKKLPRALLPQVSEALRRHAGTDEQLAKMLREVNQEK